MKRIIMVLATALILISIGIGIGTVIAVAQPDNPRGLPDGTFHLPATSMLVIYTEADDKLVMILPGPADFEVANNQLLVNGEVLLTDISGLGYDQYPIQAVPQYVPYSGQETPTIASMNLRDFNTRDLPLTMHWARVSAFTPNTKKPVTVTREWQNQNWTVNCYVALSARDAYLAGDINIGDYVLVSFVDGRANQAIVIDGVVKTW